MFVCLTHWKTVVTPVVTQADSAVKENGMAQERESQGSETSTEGNAVLNH